MAALHAREKFLTGILGGLEAFVTVDPDWRLTFANAAALQLAGMSEDELLGQDLRGLAEEEFPGFDFAALERAMREKATIEFEAATPGRAIVLACTAYPLADGGLAVYGRDVTEGRQEEHDRRTSVELYRELVESVNSAVLRWDRDGVLTFMNDYAVSLFGWQPEEIIGGPVTVLVPPPRPGEPDLSHLDEEVLADPERYATNVNENVTKDGRRLWMAWTNRALHDEEGAIREVLAIGNDITELVQAQEALRESEERFRAVQDNSLDRFTLLKPYLDDQGQIVDFTYVYQNAEAAKTAGRSPQELVGRRISEVFPSFPQTHFFTVYKQVAETGQAMEFEDRYSSDGVDEWFRATVTPNSDGIAVATQIITERKHAEEALRRQAEMIELSFDAILVWQPGGTIESWNRGAEELYGFSKAEAVGQVSHDLLATIHERPWPEIEATVRERGVWEGEVRHHAKGGREILVSSRHQLIPGGDGVERVLETNRDITEHRLAETERELLLEAAGALNRPVELADVLDTLARISLDVGGHSRIVISLWQEDLGCLTVARSRGEAALPDGMAVAIEDLSAPARRAIERHETVVIDYDALEPGRRGMGDTYTSHLALDVPLVYGGRFVGLLASDDPGARREFSARQIRLLEGIAAHAAVAIENARVYEAETAAQIQHAAEEERSRLARDLHDSVTQALFAATLKAEALTLAEDSSSGGTAEVAEDVRRLNRGALAQMRTLLLELRGDRLEDVPIGQLLQHLVEAAEGRASIKVRLSLGGESDLPPAMHEPIYRIAQEALNNVVRHAKAQNATVELRCEAGSVRLLVRDDGLGFDTSAVSAGHFGLATMRERATETGGELHLESRAGVGTTVSVIWQTE